MHSRCQCSPIPTRIGSAWCVHHDGMRPALPPCMRSQSRREGRDFPRLSQASLFKRTSRFRRIARMPLGIAAYAQSAFHADQVDCARLALIAKDARSAKFASSANPRTRDGKGHCDGRWSAGSEASAAPRASSTSSLSLPPTGHLLSTSDKRTCITPLVTAFTTSRTGIVHPKPHTVASLISSRSNVPKK